MKTETKKSAHTPGPWKVEGHARGGDRIIRLERTNTSEDWVALACDYNKFESDGEVDANARLIAAAPDLLEALKSIENDDGSIPAAIWDLRNAAIAKATGEE